MWKISNSKWIQNAFFKIWISFISYPFPISYATFYFALEEEDEINHQLIFTALVLVASSVAQIISLFSADFCNVMK